MPAIDLSLIIESTKMGWLHTNAMLFVEIIGLSPGAAIERICTNGDWEVQCASPVICYLCF